MSSGPTHFVVMATGQIEGAKFEGHDSLYCRYAFSMGEDWTVMKGVEEGITQLSSASGASSEGGQVAVWNFPIDVTFRSTCAHRRSRRRIGCRARSRSCNTASHERRPRRCVERPQRQRRSWKGG